MIVWITGAKGFIGQHLARHLADKEHTVLGIGHGLWPEAADEARLKFWLNGEISTSNLTSLRAICGLPDLVVHLAGGASVGGAVANPFEDFSRTVSTTAELLEWLRLNSSATRVVVVSSAAVYGSSQLGRISEAAPTHPVSPYGFHKLMMEQLCRSYAACYGMKCGVLRLFSVYGSGLRKQLLWDICRRLLDEPKSIELSGTGDELRDWTHIFDVVRAIEATYAMASPEVPVFNLGSGQATTVRDIAQTVIDVFAEKGISCELRFNGAVRPGDPFSLVADPHQLQELGFVWHVKPQDGISEYVRWFLSQSAGRK